MPGSSSPRIGGYNALNLNNGGMSSYTYGPSSSTYSGSAPTRPYTPNGIYPGALSELGAGELSSDSVNSTRSRRGSGAVSPPPGSIATIPRSAMCGITLTEKLEYVVRIRMSALELLLSEWRKCVRLRDMRAPDDDSITVTI